MGIVNIIIITFVEVFGGTERLQVAVTCFRIRLDSGRKKCFSFFFRLVLWPCPASPGFPSCSSYDQMSVSLGEEWVAGNQDSLQFTAFRPHLTCLRLKPSAYFTSIISKALGCFTVCWRCCSINENEECQRSRGVCIWFPYFLFSYKKKPEGF